MTGLLRRAGRRRLLAHGAAGVILWPLAARAQSRRVPRIGYLGVASRAELMRGGLVFEAGLRELGRAPGSAVAIEYRHADGIPARLAPLARELVRLPVDVIFAPTTAAALAARQATDTIPIVVANVGQPVEIGLARSLAHPGGNVTGLTYYVSPAIVGKQVELLRDTLPSLSRLSVLHVGNVDMAEPLSQVQRAAARLMIRVQAHEVNEAHDLGPAFERIGGERSDALLVLPHPVLGEHRAMLGALALRYRLPSMFGSREDMAPGCLMSYGVNRLEAIRRAAVYVDRILKGERAGELPMEQPTKFDLVINLASARSLGIRVPEALLARADEVIE